MAGKQAFQRMNASRLTSNKAYGLDFRTTTSRRLVLGVNKDAKAARKQPKAGPSAATQPKDGGTQHPSS